MIVLARIRFEPLDAKGRGAAYPVGVLLVPVNHAVAIQKY